MRARVGFAILAIAAVVAIGWWWHGRGEPARDARSTSTAATHGSDGGAPIAIRPSAARARLEGRVTAADGPAVPTAVVMASTRDGAPITVAARPDGTFTFDALPPGTYRVIAAAPGFLPERQLGVALRRGQTTRVELTLSLGGTALRGTVTDASGGPIAGAIVTATQGGFFTFFSRGGPPGAGAAAITDAQGRYALSLAAGRYRIVAHHPEYVEASDPITIGAVELVLDFQLLPGGAVEGVVMDVATGAPLPGALVVVERERLGGWNEDPGDRPVTARAGDDGRFRVPGLSPGTLTVRAELDAYGQQSEEPVIVALGIAEQVGGLELWLKGAPFLTGRVIDEHGAPVADALVLADGRGWETVHTDADGGFRFDALQPGKWKLTAASERTRPTAPVTIVMAEVPTGEVVLKVETATRLIGRIEPATAAGVTVETADLRREFMDQDASSIVAARRATAGDDGRFELMPMRSGKWTLVARAADGRRGTIDVDVPTTGSIEAVIQLDVGGSVAGRVIDERGAAVPGAAVLVSYLGKRQFNHTVNGVDLQAERAPTGPDGTFLLGALAAGNYQLTVVDDRGGLLRWVGGGQARAPKPITLAEREHKTGIELAVERNDGTIRGLVRGADGAPRADAWVVAMLRAEERSAMLGTRSGNSGAAEDRSGVGGTPPVLTDAEGRFEVRGLRRGIYDVTAEADRGAVRGRTERVATGTETTVRLVGLVAIEGTVTSNGKPVDEFGVQVILPLDAGRRSQRFRDAAGHFRFERFDPGRYQVRVTTATASGNAEVTVAGDVVRLTIDVVGDLATAHGQIVDDDGKALEGVAVTARPTSATTNVPAEVSTNSYGRFDLDVAAGSYALVVGGVVTAMTFTVVDGQTLMLEPTTKP